MTSQELIGTWKLVSMHTGKKGEGLKPWGNNPHGTLVYTPEGRMAVGINSELPSDASLELIFKNTVFYSGTYRFEPGLVIHDVTEAANPTRVGKPMYRIAKLEGDILTLSTKDDEPTEAVIVWQKY